MLARPGQQRSEAPGRRLQFHPMANAMPNARRIDSVIGGSPVQCSAPTRPDAVGSAVSIAVGSSSRFHPAQRRSPRLCRPSFQPA
jgi:hypothetical protein